MNTIDVACRNCFADRQKRCRNKQLDTVVYLSTFHAERIIDAAGMDDPNAPPLPDIPKDVIDAALADLI